MRRRGALATGVVVAAAAVALVTAVVWTDDRRPDLAPATVMEYPAGQRPAAPSSLAGRTLDGGHLSVADLRGDVVVVNYWASWCFPCRAETDDLEEVHQATRERGVSFVGINIEDERDKAVRFLEGRVSYPSIFDPGFETGLGFTDPPAPPALPATLVIDRAGRIAAVYLRVIGPSELERMVTRLATEATDG